MNFQQFVRKIVENLLTIFFYMVQSIVTFLKTITFAINLEQHKKG